MNPSIKKILFSALTMTLLLASGTLRAEQLRYICGGSTVEYSKWGLRSTQMSSFSDDPLIVLVDRDKKTITFSAIYADTVTAALKEDREWFEGEASVDKIVMDRKIATVSVKVGRLTGSGITLYTLDKPGGENHLAFAGICTITTAK